jgi:glycosyltransferase involved in cell wall biosynthesis
VTDRGAPARPWLIDGRGLLGLSGVRGIGTYLRELLIAWHQLGAASRVILLRGRDSLDPALGVAAGPRVATLKRRFQPIADPFLVSLALRRARPALYHGVEWGQPLAPLGVPVILTIHDLIPFVFPELYPWIRRERLLALRLARRADSVIVPSRATALDVERLGRVDPARIHVIPHGVSPRYSPAPATAVDAIRARLGLGTRPYVLSAGTLDERKRREGLAEVMSRVRATADVSLVIAGDQGNYLPRVHAALHNHGIADDTVMAGFVGVDDLVTLYSGAAALVFTSAYEGFGLPVLEAMACGTRVVCFDNSALPEVAGECAVLVPDGDTAAMASAVVAVLDQSAHERSARVTAGRAWSAGFTWERSARAHLDIYAAQER